MGVAGAERRIIEAAARWQGVTSAPHRYGGLEFRLGRREIGHVHGDRLVDIPFPKPVRDALIETGQAEPHHILPRSGWVSIFLRSDADVERAIGLLERSYRLAADRSDSSGKNNDRQTHAGAASEAKGGAARRSR
jgi:Luciferase